MSSIRSNKLGRCGSVIASLALVVAAACGGDDANSYDDGPGTGIAPGTVPPATMTDTMATPMIPADTMFSDTLMRDSLGVMQDTSAGRSPATTP